MQKIINALLVVLLLSATTAKASQIDTETTYKGKISVSLLTVSPGNQIYEKFGHTGIRIQIPSKKFDGVYHYGLFSFEDPNFEYRFVKGETDYMIGLMHYHDFLTMYAIRGSSVRELPINLTNEEALNLFAKKVCISFHHTMSEHFPISLTVGYFLSSLSFLGFSLLTSETEHLLMYLQAPL